MIWEALNEAKREQRLSAACWLDFKNAFGSVKHYLIRFALNHYHVGDQFKPVVGNFYSSLYTIVQTSKWTIGAMPYQIWVFQGDPLSVAIFDMVTNLFADAIIQHSDRMAYYFKSTGDPFVLLFFADAAVMVANSAKHCQKLCHRADKFLT